MEKKDVVSALGALAQDTRLDIMRHLVRLGPDGAAAGQIGDRFGLPSATLAFHLNALASAGLVTRRKSGRQNIYRADFAAVHALTAYLLDQCCAGPELGDAAASAANDDAA